MEDDEATMVSGVAITQVDGSIPVEQYESGNTIQSLEADGLSTTTDQRRLINTLEKHVKTEQIKRHQMEKQIQSLQKMNLKLNKKILQLHPMHLKNQARKTSQAGSTRVMATEGEE